MRLRVEHTTVSPTTRRSPRATPSCGSGRGEGEGQRCLGSRLVTDPAAAGPRLSETDYRKRRPALRPAGRPRRAHGERALGGGDARAVSRTRERRAARLLDQFDYLAPTAYAPFTSEIRALAEPCRVPGDAFAAATRVLWTVRRHLRYASGTTDVTTNADRGPAAGDGRLPGLRPPDDRGLPRGGSAGALRLRLYPRARAARPPPLRTPGWTCSRNARAGCPSTPPTTARRAEGTCGWQWAATTTTCPRRAACSRASPARPSRCPCASTPSSGVRFEGSPTTPARRRRGAARS